VRTIRGEVLDWTLVLGRPHLDSILRGYERHASDWTTLVAASSARSPAQSVRSGSGPGPAMQL